MNTFASLRPNLRLQSPTPSSGAIHGILAADRPPPRLACDRVLQRGPELRANDASVVTTVSGLSLDRGRFDGVPSEYAWDRPDGPAPGRCDRRAQTSACVTRSSLCLTGRRGLIEHLRILHARMTGNGLRAEAASRIPRHSAVDWTATACRQNLFCRRPSLFSRKGVFSDGGNPCPPSRSPTPRA